MCNSCYSSAKDNRGDLDMADRLESLAVYYRDSAYGRVKPHTEQTTKRIPLAIGIIRRLVEDWI